jgi:hypothetical protein
MLNLSIKDTELTQQLDMILSKISIHTLKQA